MEQMKSYTHGCTLKTEYNLGKQTMHNITEQTPWLSKIISEVLCRFMAEMEFKKIKFTSIVRTVQGVQSGAVFCSYQSM